jgi:hypothetical protein
VTVPMGIPIGAPATVQDAVFSLFLADVDLRTYLGSLNNDADPRIYEALAPPGTLLRTPDTEVPWPYLTLRGPAENPLATYGPEGRLATDTVLVVSIWVPGTLERLAKVGAELVRSQLEGAILALPGYRLWSVTAGSLLVQSDPDGQATQARREFTFHAAPEVP